MEVIFYDGVCRLCNRFVRFVLKRDRADRFRFAALQSPFAREALAPHGKDPSDLDTFYLIQDQGGPSERILARGRAALQVLRGLGGVWKAAALALGLLPTPVLDAVYSLVVKNRYRLFGKHESCPVPDPRHRHKFL